MPLKSGRLTVSERGVAEQVALTGSPAAAAAKLGMSASGVRAALTRPAVQAEIAKKQQELLFSDILPLAVAAHKRILSDPRTPAGAVVQAVKLAYDRTLGSEDAGRAKEPHEMTPEELAQAIGLLERVASERAKPVNAVEIDDVETIDEAPETPGKVDLFA
jgi:hypothetical protein